MATFALSLAAPSAVTVAVYDALGRRVAVAHEGVLGAGAHRVALPVAGLRAGVHVARFARLAFIGSWVFTVTR